MGKRVKHTDAREPTMSASMFASIILYMRAAEAEEGIFSGNGRRIGFICHAYVNLIDFALIKQPSVSLNRIGKQLGE